MRFIKTIHTLFGMKKYGQPYTAQENKLLLYNGSCKACGEENAKMYKCSVCLVTRYCSRECQKFDWKVHKLACKTIKPDDPKVKLSKISLHFATDIAVSMYAITTTTPSDNFDIKPICSIIFNDNSFRQLELGASADKIVAGCKYNWVSKESYLIMHNEDLSSFTLDNIGIAILYGGESIFYTISKVEFMLKVDNVKCEILDVLETVLWGKRK